MYFQVCFNSAYPQHSGERYRTSGPLVLNSGPIENIIDNAQDITRSLSCASELIANHTATKWKFRMQPVGNVLKDMQVCMIAVTLYDRCNITDKIILASYFMFCHKVTFQLAMQTS